MTREELNEEIHQELENEEKQGKRKRLIKIFVKSVLIFIVVFSAFYFYTTYVSTVMVGVREYRVKCEKIPDSFDGLKIIQFSDLHFGSTVFDDNMKKIRNIINIRKPHIIVFTGDLIAKNYSLSSKEQERLTNELQQLSASLGKYAIVGDEDVDIISTIFNQSNFTVLKNEYDLIYNNQNDPILLIGISSIKKDQDIDKAYSYFQEEQHSPNIYTIVMMHEPDAVDSILRTYSADLILAGHSHNGDVRIPFLKTSLFKRKGALKYDQDFYKIGDSKLFISSGLGTENGIRLFCRPSINFFRLSSQ